jgi:hypothetical protein
MTTSPLVILEQLFAQALAAGQVEDLQALPYLAAADQAQALVEELRAGGLADSAEYRAADALVKALALLRAGFEMTDARMPAVADIAFALARAWFEVAGPELLVARLRAAAGGP